MRAVHLNVTLPVQVVRVREKRFNCIFSREFWKSGLTVVGTRHA
jgi:hypothetical protein